VLQIDDLVEFRRKISENGMCNTIFAPGGGHTDEILGRAGYLAAGHLHVGGAESELVKLQQWPLLRVCRKKRGMAAEGLTGLRSFSAQKPHQLSSKGQGLQFEARLVGGDPERSITKHHALVPD
jgi:hypothetical protein